MRKILLLVLTMLPMMGYAQDDFGVWASLGAEKKIDKHWSAGIEGEYRSRNDAKTVDRWSLEADASYKFANWLKASAGYAFLYDHNKEKTTYKSNGDTNNLRPSYWGIRHRFHIDLTGDADLGRFNLSLRERWQYTYRPEKTTTRYDFDNEYWEDTTVKGKGKNVLRSRFQVEYKIPDCAVEPYANVEIFNGWALQKVRYTLGADWKIRKHHVVGLYYRYQTVNDDDDDNEPDSHILGVSYTYKF
ncbi:MAG: DUF2490 domain-containing protein [Prevotella sp.]|jgi:opacity protein-like surface antigen|nr:DUF2490 domain-containing protein [Prevotella sp.]MCI1282391.1 DUF2490 domain-containing protein [Prevotella sp.]